MKIAYISPITAQKSVEKVDEFEYVVKRRHIQPAIHMKKKGADVVFYRYTTQRRKYTKYFQGVKIVFCPVTVDFKKRKDKHRWNGGYEYSVEILKQLNSFNPDIIHFYNFLLPSYWFFYIYSKFKSIKILSEHVGGSLDLTPHNRLISFSRIKRFLTHQFIRGTDKLQVYIDAERQRLLSIGVQNSKLLQDIPHIGIDTNIFRPIDRKIACTSTGLNHKKINILYVGRIVKDNNLDFNSADVKSPFILLDLIKELNKENERYHLIIVGDGPDFPFLLEKIQKYNLANQITTTSWISSQKNSK